MKKKRLSLDTNTPYLNKREDLHLRKVKTEIAPIGPRGNSERVKTTEAAARGGNSRPPPNKHQGKTEVADASLYAASNWVEKQARIEDGLLVRNPRGLIG